MSSDISVDSDQFIDIISADLEANSSYKVRGVVGIARIGGDSQILFKMDYSGTSFMNYFDVKYVIVGANGESTTYKLQISSKDYVFEAFIRTTSAGTYKVQIAKTNAGNDDSTVLSGSKFIISKTD